MKVASSILARCTLQQVPILTGDPQRESDLQLQIRIRIVHAQDLHTNQGPQSLCNLIVRAPNSQQHAVKRGRNGTTCRCLRGLKALHFDDYQ